MKYISKAHLITLAVIVVILGVMLLLGEKYSNQSFFWKETSIPTEPVGTGEENLLYNFKEPQSQMEGQQMESKSFVIRPGNKLSYTDALELYKRDVLQFNESCQVSSGYRNFGLNNEIMLDNRSAKATTVTVGNNMVVLGPYDFGFMILKEEGESIAVDCGGKKNVVFLTVK